MRNCILFFLLALLSCEEMERPANLVPQVTVAEATEVTRDAATISGTVSKTTTAEVSTLCFRYGTDQQMNQTVTCDLPASEVSAKLAVLTPATTYYYCLEAGNGYSHVRSETRHFTTMPTVAPTTGDLQLVNQGPFSITLQYEITDNGGEPLTTTGFYYRAEGGEEQQLLLTVSPDARLYYGRIGSLSPKTTYHIEAFAANETGETRGTPYTFTTQDAVTLTEAGTLPQVLGEEEKYLFTSLTVAGPLNGTDLRYLRDALGRNIGGGSTEGRLVCLNLSDAQIVEGGLSYDDTHYTKTDVVGYGLFADCPYLQEVQLPDGITTIEEKAFDNCGQLTRLFIPASVSQLGISNGCSKLTAIEVAEGNEAFCSQDGAVYNKNKTTLVWFPDAKSTADPLPQTLTAIGEYAFRNSCLTGITLPDGVNSIGRGAFHKAALTHITLPDGVEQLGTGTFQDCKGLINVTIGSGIQLLPSLCFEGCPLQELHVRANTFAPVCRSDTFGSSSTELMKSCTLYVPAGCKSLYRSASYWKAFEKIVEEEEN